MAQTFSVRSEIPQEFTWNLTDLFPDDQAWQEEFDRLQQSLTQLSAYAGRLHESAGVLLAFLQLQDEVEVAADRMISYAMRKTDQDTRESVYQEMSAQARNFIVAWEQALAFQTPELLAIDEATLDAFYQQEPKLEHYRLLLTRIRRKKDHTLSAEGEGLLAAAGSMGQAPGSIFALMNNADMTFEDAVDSNGEHHPVSHGSYIPLMESSDRVLRQSAFRSLYAGFGKLKNTCSAVLGAQMKQLQFFADARRYPSALHAALAETEVPVEIYHNLIQTVHGHLPTMHRYVRLRKKLLGVEELHYYDLYAPMVADVEMDVPFAMGKELACKALTADGLCAKYADLNRLYYGEDIVADPEIALEWARIPHFFYNFYVYQYATGFASAVALSQRILNEGQPAVEDYLNFLSGGCSADPVTLLKGAGVDLSTPAPVADALKYFDRLLSEMESLLSA